MGTHDFVDKGTTYSLPCQIVDIVGTPTADGWFRFETTAGSVKGSSAAQYFNAGEFGQMSIAVDFMGTAGADPAGMASIGGQFGLMGAAMNKTVEPNAGYVTKGRQIVLRNVPSASLKLNGAQKPEVAVGLKSGVAVNIRLYIACLQAAQVETVAYAAPFNLSKPFAANGGTNPLTQRPDLTGTKTVGSTLTLNPPTISGGGAGLYGNSYIKDAANNTIATFANTANPLTYALTSADSGKTERMTGDASNTFGAIVIDDGPAYAIP